MKLIIQIPCFNEEETLPLVFENMPKKIEGIDVIEYQIIDDCSTDNTIEVAKKLGVHHIVKVKGENKRWLGRAFKMGIDNALKEGADIVVNTDGDNQYPSEEIASLIKPIIELKADIVIGDRNPSKFKEFSLIKRILQGLGSKTVEFITKSTVKDAVSGFRAYNKESLYQINIFTNFTYTIDTLVQAINKGLTIYWHPIVPNAKTRDSRLITSIISKVRKSGATILRVSTVYNPFKTFSLIGLLFLVPGIALFLRYLYFFLFIEGGSAGHLQSILAGSVLILISFLMFTLGILGDLLAVNRYLLDATLTKLRKIEYKK